MTGVAHAPTAFATEAYTPGTPVIVPIPKQLGSASGRGLEIQPIVSDHAILTIVAANYWSFSTRLWLPIDHHRSRCPMP